MTPRTRLVIGGVQLAVGVAITALSYAYAYAPPGGRAHYVVMSGLIALGVINIARGVLGTGKQKIRDHIGTTGAPRGEEQPWTAGEALGIALTGVGEGAAATPSLLYFLLTILAGGAAAAAGLVLAWPETSLYALTAIAGTVASALTIPALCVACLNAVRGGGDGAWARGFRSAPRLLVFAVLSVPLSVIAWSPVGIIFLPFALTPFFVVDQNVGVIEAMGRSWRASRHSFGALWLLHLAMLPLRLIATTSVVGLLLALPLYYLALAYAYVRVSGTTDLEWFPPAYSSRAYRRFFKLTLAALALTLAGLVYKVKQLPTLRGTAWSIHDTAIRATAIVTSVVVVIVVLALLLPYILDRLEGRRFTTFVAARHVRSQKSGFLTVISILSICGVAISSCALSSVVSVMGGFSQDLKRKILGNNAHIVIDTTPGTPFADYEGALERVRAIPGVVGAAPVVHGEVMASSASNLAGVIVTGVEPSSITNVIELANNIEVGKLDYLEHPEKLTKLPANEVIGMGPGGEQYFKGAELPGLADDIDPSVRAVILNKPDRPGIILGRELAKTLHVYVGDEVTLVSPLGDLGPMGVMPRTKRFRVAGIFYSGMYEYDATYVYTMIDVAQDYFQTANKISAIEVKVEDAERAEQVTPKVAAAVERPDLRVRDWREINKNLFSALKLERFATFIILSIAIMVASFCIVCTLLLMVTEKGKEIAILKAVGASDGAILRIFMFEGMIIGGIGTVFGVVTGLSVCTGLSWFGLRLDPEVYYIDRLPISVNGGDFFIVALSALVICTLSTLYPALAASRLRPVDGLRYE